MDQISVIELLKDAIYEQIEAKRINKLVRACKKISDLLPYDEQNVQLLNFGSELFKYLLILCPIFETTISLILSSIQEKFCQNVSFIMQFWNALEDVSKIKEDQTDLEIQQQKQKTKIVNINQLQQNQQSIKEQNLNVMLRYQFCRDIQQKRVEIKLGALKRCYKLVKSFHDCSQFITKYIKVFDLFKHFLQYTNSEVIINTVCQKLFKIKQLWQELWKDSNVENEIEEILLSKSNQFIPPLLIKTYDISEANSPLNQKTIQFSRKQQQKSQTIINAVQENQIAKDNSQLNALNFSQASKNQMEDQKKQARIKIDDQISNISFSDDDDEDSTRSDQQLMTLQSSDQKVKNRQKQLLKKIKKCEEFLNINLDEMPIIAKNEFLLVFFKKVENYELYLSLIFDPMGQPISKIWALEPLFIKPISQFQNQIQIQNDKTRNCPTPRFRKSWKKVLTERQKKYINFFVMRSYKALQLLIETKNRRYLQMSLTNISEVFFQHLYDSLQKKSAYKNMNHVAILIEMMIRKDPPEAFYYFFKFNIILQLILYLDFPQIKMLILNLLGLTQNPLGCEFQKMIWQYCQMSQFFVEMSKLALYGNILRLNNIIFSKDYKFGGIQKLIAQCKNDSIYFTETNEVTGLQQFDSQFQSNKNAQQQIRTQHIKQQFTQDIDQILFAIKKSSKLFQSVQSLLAVSRKDKNQLQKSKTIVQNQQLSLQFPSPRVKKVKKGIDDQLLKIKFQKEMKKQQLSQNFLKAKILYNNESLSILTKDAQQLIKNQTDILPLISTPARRFKDLRNKKEQLQNLLAKQIFNDKRQNIENDKKSKQKKLKQNTKIHSKSQQIETLKLIKNNMHQITSLYPMSKEQKILTDIEQMGKNESEFNQNFIKLNDLYSTIIMEMMFHIIQYSIDFLQHSQVHYLIGAENRDIQLLINSIFSVNSSQAFDLIFKNYLLKILLYDIMNQETSGCASGKIINLLLRTCNSLFHLIPFQKQFHQISLNHFNTLQKMIIQCFNANQEQQQLKKFRKYQTIELHSHLSLNLYLLLETMALIIENDLQRHYKILDEVYLSTWDCLINLFFQNITHSLFQQLFIKMMKKVFMKGSDSLKINLIFKLNLLSHYQKITDYSIPNNVLQQQLQIDSIFSNLKILYNIIQLAIAHNPNSILNEQLNKLELWKEIKSRFEKNKEPLQNPLLINEEDEYQIKQQKRQSFEYKQNFPFINKKSDSNIQLKRRQTLITTPFASRFNNKKNTVEN